jgi:hypothetical protein
MAQAALPPARSGAELGKAAHDALRRWARAGDREAAAAAQEFLGLFRELQADTRLPRAERESLQQKVRGRLLSLAPQITKRAAIEKRLAKEGRPASVGAAIVGQPVLAQFGGFGGQGFGGQGFGGGGGGFGAPGFGGGMGMVGGAPGGAVGGNALLGDAGPDLVDLIQKTISPASWDVNGGLGSIYYWRPGFSIVVRQTDGVHEQLADMIQQLQRAGN